MQLWAVLRGNTRINSDQGGWRSLACAGGDQGETEMLSGRMSLLQGDWYVC